METADEQNSVYPHSVVPFAERGELDFVEELLKESDYQFLNPAKRLAADVLLTNNRVDVATQFAKSIKFTDSSKQVSLLAEFVELRGWPDIFLGNPSSRRIFLYDSPHRHALGRLDEKEFVLGELERAKRLGLAPSQGVLPMLIFVDGLLSDLDASSK